MLLLIIFMNDFSNCLQHSLNISFADDTNVFITGANFTKDSGMSKSKLSSL